MSTNNYDVQAAMVAYLKTKTVITDEVTAAEIREDQWQGTEFIYPNVRVRMISNQPLDTNCDAAEVMYSIQIYSQQDSSIEAERIAGIINSALHARSFESLGVRFSTRTTNQVPAYRQDTRTWRSEILMRATVTG